MKNNIILISLFFFTINTPIFTQNKAVLKQISKVLKKTVLAKADTALTLKPITVTAERCERSAGGVHDFY